MKRYLQSIGLLLLLGTATTLFADLMPYDLVGGQLVPVGSAGASMFTATNFSGTGFGNVDTVLTLQERGSESGCIAPNGSTSNCGYTQDGLKNQIGTPTLSTVFANSGIAAPNAANLFIVLNANEPAGSNLTLTGLTLLLGSGSNQMSFQCPSCSNLTLQNTLNGAGQSGFIFGLSSDQAKTANAFITSNGLSNVTIGLGASLTGTQGGAESFYALAFGNAAASAVPEPPSLTMWGAGLVGLSLVYRRFVRRGGR